MTALKRSRSCLRSQHGLHKYTNKRIGHVTRTSLRWSKYANNPFKLYLVPLPLHQLIFCRVFLFCSTCLSSVIRSSTAILVMLYYEPVISQVFPSLFISSLIDTRTTVHVHLSSVGLGQHRPWWKLNDISVIIAKTNFMYFVINLNQSLFEFVKFRFCFYFQWGTLVILWTLYKHCNDFILVNVMAPSCNNIW